MRVYLHNHSVSKRWPESYFAKVADYLINEFSVQIVFTDTKDEKILIDNTNKEMKSDKSRVEVAGNFNLSQLAFLIKQLDVYIGADTGPLHLAIAMGVSTVSFFGHNTPTLYGPPTNNNHICSYEDMYCSPCLTNYNAKMSKCLEPQCLTKITPEKVINSLDRFLGF